MAECSPQNEVSDDSDAETTVFHNLFDECEDWVYVPKQESNDKTSESEHPLAISDEFFTACEEESEDNSDSDSDSSDLKFNLFDDTDDECDNKPAPTTVSCDTPESTVDTSDSPYHIEVGDSHTMYRQHVHNRTKLPEWTGPTPDDEEFCCICMDAKTNAKTLHKCSHSFCSDCIEESFKLKPVCPVCFVAYGKITGNQPDGYMNDRVNSKLHLPGYEDSTTIVVSYGFGSGIQSKNHPNPGVHYEGTSRTAYLPNNEEGRKVLRLLRESFNRKLTFTIGRSRTTGCDNVVTWNDIHHKTCTHGGQDNFGYPDPTYLQRVQEELAAKGVTEESLNNS